MTIKEKLTLEKFGKFVMDEKVSNDFLVKIIELSGNFLNIQTISNYAKSNNISYNGAKKCREVIELFGVKFIVDNQ